MIDPTSVILTCLAIFLSCAFFWMSYKMSERVSDAARRIEMSVEKLETVFNLQYSDILSLTKEAFSDMRKHAWSDKVSEEGLSKLAEEKINEGMDNIRSEMSGEIDAKLSEIGRKTEQTDSQIAEIRTSMKKLLGTAIDESSDLLRQIQAETLDGRILLYLLDMARDSQYITDAEELSKQLGYSEGFILSRLKVLQKRCIVGSGMLGTKIRYALTPDGIKEAERIEAELLEK